MGNAAERTIDVQYFIFQADDTGRMLTNAMLRGRPRGARVLITYRSNIY